MYVLFLLCLYILYIVFATQLPAVVQIVQSLRDTTVAPALRPKRGTRSVPFYLSPAGLVTSATGPRAAYVHFVHSTWRPNGCSPSSSLKGDPNGPLFYPSPAGLFTSRPGTRTRAHQRLLSLDPGSTCTL